MGQRGEAEIWLPSSFHCYLFKFRFHGQLIFSLNRRPCLPLNGAHVAQEQFNYRWPLPHVAGSPDRRVLSVSLTSTRSSDPSHLFGLAGPTGLRLNRMDLPCSRCFLWLHAGGTEPREHLRPLALSRPRIPPSPLIDRGGYSDHVRFRGYIPVHFIPAYNLPVYASQRPLPDATQDSVRGCSLGFAAAVVADGRLQRACKAQRSSNRTCPIKASGSPTGFTARHTGSELTARGFGAVSNSPSPLDTAISGGACR